MEYFGQHKFDNQVSANTIQLNKGVSAPTHSEGQLYWDSLDHTLAAQTDIVGTTLQIGQETFLRVTNKTGALIPNGAVVVIQGAQGDRPKAVLADCTSEELSEHTIGVSTADIGNDDDGYVTTFGLVRDLHLPDASFNTGDIVYLSTNGSFNSTKPLAPYHGVRVGMIITTSEGNSGKMFVEIKSNGEMSELHDVSYNAASLTTGQVLKWASANQRWEPGSDSTVTGANGILVTSNQATLANYNGLDPNTSVNISYNESTLTVTLSGNSANIYVDGAQYSVPTGTYSHNSSTGSYFLYANSSGTVTFNTQAWTIVNDAPIAYVYYNATTGKGIMIDERHPAYTGMDNRTHLYNHLHNGTLVTSGFGISSYTVNSSTLVNVQPSIDSGVISDEDLPTTITFNGKGTYNCWYRSGADNAGEWSWTVNDTPYLHSTAIGTYNGNPQWNQLTGGNWQQTDITNNNRWFNIWVCAVPAVDSTQRIIFIQGQAEYTSSATATAQTFTQGISWGTYIPFSEIAPLYQIVCRRVGNTTSYSTQIESINRLIGTKIVLTGVTASTSHSALSNRSDANSHPATALSTDTTNFNDRLSASDTTVQAALDTLDGAARNRSYTLRSTDYSTSTASTNTWSDRFATTWYSKLGDIQGDETLQSVVVANCFGLKIANALGTAYGRATISVNGVGYVGPTYSTNATDYVQFYNTFNVSVNDWVDSRVVWSWQAYTSDVSYAYTVHSGLVTLHEKYTGG